MSSSFADSDVYVVERIVRRVGTAAKGGECVESGGGAREKPKKRRSGPDRRAGEVAVERRGRSG